MKCDLLEIKNGEIRKICTGLMIARLGNDILLIESGTFKKSLGNIFKKERNSEQLESLVDVASKENLISEQELEINLLQKKISQLKDEHEKQIASLKGKCSVLTKRLENYTSGVDDELEVVRDRYGKHISKLEDDHIKAIDERNEYKNKLNKTNEVLKQTEKEKELYISYLEAAEGKKTYIRKQRNEYKNLLEQKQQELESLKSKKAEPSDYLRELDEIPGSLESIVKKIFFESPDLTEEQAIILLKKVKSSFNNKRRWRSSTIHNRIDTYLKKQSKIVEKDKNKTYMAGRVTFLKEEYKEKKIRIYITFDGMFQSNLTGDDNFESDIDCLEQAKHNIDTGNIKIKKKVNICKELAEKGRKEKRIAKLTEKGSEFIKDVLAGQIEGDDWLKKQIHHQFELIDGEIVWKNKK